MLSCYHTSGYNMYIVSTLLLTLTIDRRIPEDTDTAVGAAAGQDSPGSNTGAPPAGAVAVAEAGAVEPVSSHTVATDSSWAVEVVGRETRQPQKAAGEGSDTRRIVVVMEEAGSSVVVGAVRTAIAVVAAAVAAVVAVSSRRGIAVVEEAGEDVQEEAKARSCSQTCRETHKDLMVVLRDTTVERAAGKEVTEGMEQMEQTAGCSVVENTAGSSAVIAEEGTAGSLAVMVARERRTEPVVEMSTVVEIEGEGMLGRSQSANSAR